MLAKLSNKNLLGCVSSSESFTSFLPSKIFFIGCWFAKNGCCESIPWDYFRLIPGRNDCWMAWVKNFTENIENVFCMWKWNQKSWNVWIKDPYKSIQVLFTDNSSFKIGSLRRFKAQLWSPIIIHSHKPRHSSFVLVSSNRVYVYSFLFLWNWWKDRANLLARLFSPANAIKIN